MTTRASAAADVAQPTTQLPVTVRVFTQRFSSTPRGARLARMLAADQLDRWGFPHGGDLCDRAALIVAELAANAVTHGRVPGRDFELTMTRAAGSVLGIEVSDARGDRRPHAPVPLPAPAPTAETVPIASVRDSGRGMLLVEALADRWSVHDRLPVGKTVRAEIDLPRRRSRCRPVPGRDEGRHDQEHGRDERPGEAGQTDHRAGVDAEPGRVHDGCHGGTREGDGEHAEG